MDIVFISFDEDNAEENWSRILKRFPHAKRVHGIDGIHNAHKQASLLSESEYFFTVDGDNQILEDFSFNVPDILDDHAVYVWRCLNRVNGLVYGYGGVKLWSKEIFERTHLSNFCDHAMEITPVYKVVDELASVTCFDSSPFSAWRSGFREAIKLYRNIEESKDDYSGRRLTAWLSVGTHQEYGKWTLLGARQGCLLALENSFEEISLLINNFSRLRKYFDQLEIDNQLDNKLEELYAKLKGFNIDLYSLSKQDSYEEALRNANNHKALIKV